MSLSIGGVVQHVRSWCPCSGVWHLDGVMFTSWFSGYFFSNYVHITDLCIVVITSTVGVMDCAFAFTFILNWLTRMRAINGGAKVKEMLPHVQWRQMLEIVTSLLCSRLTRWMSAVHLCFKKGWEELSETVYWLWSEAVKTRLKPNVTWKELADKDLRSAFEYRVCVHS